jgi:hypothetical protein
VQHVGPHVSGFQPIGIFGAPAIAVFSMPPYCGPVGAAGLDGAAGAAGLAGAAGAAGADVTGADVVGADGAVGVGVVGAGACAPQPIMVSAQTSMTTRIMDAFFILTSFRNYNNEIRL